jgi:hypothetical protein
VPFPFIQGVHRAGKAGKSRGFQRVRREKMTSYKNQKSKLVKYLKQI